MGKARHEDDTLLSEENATGIIFFYGGLAPRIQNLGLAVFLHLA